VSDDLEQVPGKIAAALAADGPPDLVLVLDNLHEITGLAVHESLWTTTRPVACCGLISTRPRTWPCCERGDLDAAQDGAQAVVEQATKPAGRCRRRSPRPT
jgi:hypothetical protein